MQVYVFTTKQCNLKCEYCYVKQENSVVDIEAFRKLTTLMRDEDCIAFFGGEPTMIPDDILNMFDIVDACESKFKVIFFSNGVIFNPEITRRLSLMDREVLVQLSYDGDRQAKIGGGSGDIVLENMRLYLAEFEGKCSKTLHIQMTVSPDSVDGILSSAKYLYSEGVRSLAFSPVVEAAWEPVSSAKYEEAVIALTNLVIDSYRANDKAAFFPITLHRNNNQDRVACGAGKDLLSMDSQGNLSTCHRYAEHFPDDPQYKVCSVYDIHNAEEFYASLENKWEISKFEHCIQCPDKQFCNKCSLAFKLTTGDPYLPPLETYCKLPSIHRRENARFVNTLLEEGNQGMIDDVCALLLEAMGKKIDKLRTHTLGDVMHLSEIVVSQGVGNGNNLR